MLDKVDHCRPNARKRVMDYPKWDVDMDMDMASYISAAYT